MDKIVMKDLIFYGFHGVLEEEKTLGQKFSIGIELYLSLKEAGRTDDVLNTVSYAQVYEVVKEIVENRRFNLIEALAENIAASIMEKFSKVKGIRVCVQKPQAPVNGMFGYFGVEIRRENNG